MRIFIFIFIIAAPVLCAGQQQRWEAYIANFEKGPGSVTTNLGLVDYKETTRYPFLVVTGVKFSNCTVDGFPAKDEFDKLYLVSDSIEAAIQGFTKHIYAGTFSYQCERLHYLYVTDTFELRQNLEEMYKTRFPGYTAKTTIKLDAGWSTFHDFLYPNEQTLEVIENGRVIAQLHKAGDKLEKPRKIDHWLYFKTEKGRADFLAYVQLEKFKVEDSSYVKDRKDSLPYSLHISRTDYVEVTSLSKTTAALRQSVRKYNGEYDGWESAVVKE
ncbi:DUF695 domain-containing protein [Foetidibacter luteolus]|uniref:DUF695 domain-containing protein n=1 Tax=Foetidibacter luteolus TaxID=2608880 RepID=UPI00129A3245|nr:DUF695 domain-containing protein [Foetidibacter luteolus]